MSRNNHTMSATLAEFHSSAARVIADPELQQAMDSATARFRSHRLEALAEFPDADELRDHFKDIRSATLAQLAEHLEAFEARATAAGASVHWARDAEEANRIIADIAASHGATLAVKSKSMTTEETHLNRALAAAGVEAVETDLGEWIVQQAGERPSHIIAPAMHKTRRQVADLIEREKKGPVDSDEIPALTAEARRLLRRRFLEADVGISGVNVAVAETGSIVLVTNEGNGRMVTSAPPVHIALMGIEKIVPTWDEAAVWLSLLARSATGQPMSIYTSIITGPRRPDDEDGPQEVHIVILDNGRSAQIGTPYEEVLQCIRCGACLNACPVYREAGGLTYGSPYSGPIGAVISPRLFGLAEYEALPHASSLCGACLDVCPARIDLPRMLLELRTDEVEARVIPWHERLAERVAAFVLGHERLMRWTSRLLRVLQRPFTRQGTLVLPERANPAGTRALPALAERSFRERWDDLT